MAQQARTQATSKKVVRRKATQARSEAGQIINWVLEAHGKMTEGVTLHESPAGIVRDYLRHRGLPLVEGDVSNLTQAFKRHPRYEPLEAGSRARRPTFRLLPPKETLKVVPPPEDPPVPDTPPA